ncbi:MAG: DUF4157 domain-containing protein [Chthoniobacterales bacterium]
MKTSGLLQAQPDAIRAQPAAPARSGLLQRLSAHRSSVNARPPDVPPIVQEVLRSPGRSLDSETRAFFEPRFGHNFSDVPIRVPARHSVSRLSVGPTDDYYEQQADLVAAKVMSPAPSAERSATAAFDFSQVRIHTGPRASASAAALGAQAYAVGRDIVFGDGKFSPHTSGGRRILAHELTHIVQQSAWAPPGQIQRLTAAERKEDLKSERLKRDPRLQRAFDNSPAMRKTEVSEGVKTLQRALRDLGYPMPISFKDGDADGIFEDETFATVKQFQVDHGLADEGTVGRETLRTLDEMFSTSLTLKAVRFTSDHGLMKDNQASWDGAGPNFAKPEWTSAIPNTKSAPISHTKNQAVKVDITLDVAPETVTRVPVNLKGQSALSFLTFNASGSLNGGKDQVLSATSVGMIPDAIDDQYQKQTIDWSAEVIGQNQVLGQSLDHAVFVTYDTPVGGGVTHKRMAKATELTKGFGNKPHDIVSGEMKRFPSYNLQKPYNGNIWPLADDILSSAECQAIVRFVQAVNNMVGVPGTAVGIAVYADPASPSVPIVASLLASGGATGAMADFPPDSQGRKAFLYDGGGFANNYEAALEFDFGGKLYYPGGVPGGHGVATTLNVLHSFKKMSWSRWDPAANRFKAVKLIFCYHPPC